MNIEALSETTLDLLRKHHANPLWIVAAAAVFLVVAWLVQRRKAGRRAALLEIAARKIGFSFDRKFDPFAADVKASVKLFDLGHAGKVKNVLRGQFAGVEALVFDFNFTEGHGEHARGRIQTIAAFRIGFRSAPNFQLRPEGLLHKIGSMFGYQDIDFDTHTRFSGRFLLRGADEAAIRNYFNKPLLDFFAELREDEWRVESAGGWLWVYIDGQEVPPMAIKSFLEETGLICAAVRRNDGAATTVA